LGEIHNVFARNHICHAVITAYAYNGDTNIFTFIGVGITLAGLVRLPKNECLVNGNNTEVKNMPIWLVILMSMCVS
jgi:hypothetical protein